MVKSLSRNAAPCLVLTRLSSLLVSVPAKILKPQQNQNNQRVADHWVYFFENCC